MILKVVGLGLLALTVVMHRYKKQNPNWLSYGGWIWHWDVPRQVLIPGAAMAGVVCLFLS
jgi:hypothetical protein